MLLHHVSLGEWSKKRSRLLLWMFPGHIISSTGVIFVPQAVCHLLSPHAHSQWLTGHRHTINYFFLFTVLQTSVNLQSVDFWFPVGLNHACCRFCRFASFVSCRATVKTLTKAFATFVIPQSMYSKNKKLVLLWQRCHNEAQQVLTTRCLPQCFVTLTLPCLHQYEHMLQNISTCCFLCTLLAGVEAGRGGATSLDVWRTSSLHYFA